MNYRFPVKCAAFVLSAMVAAACQSGPQSLMSPSASISNGVALNADGSNLKVSTPLALSPLFEQTNTAVQPVLAAQGSTGTYVPSANLSHRFQVADSDAFSNIVSSGTGASDAAGITRWTVETALTANKRYLWRVRAEMGDAFGPWSN